MNPIILRTAARVVLPLLLVFSVFLFVRGHNSPGGGFIGGLTAALAFCLHLVAHDPAATRRVLRLRPRTFAAGGLALAGLSGLGSLLHGRPFMTAAWSQTTVPGLGKLAIGTPLVFDLGVYFVVFGVSLGIVLTLAEN